MIFVLANNKNTLVRKHERIQANLSFNIKFCNQSDLSSKISLKAKY